MTVGPLANADVSAYNLVLRNGASPDGDVTHGGAVARRSDRFSLAETAHSQQHGRRCASLGRMSCPPSSPSPRT